MVFERERTPEHHESEELDPEVNPAAFGASPTRAESPHLPPIEGRPVEPPFHRSLN
jgi:hypothetical protein